MVAPPRGFGVSDRGPVSSPTSDAPLARSGPAVPLQDIRAHNAPFAAALVRAAARVLGSGQYVLGGERSEVAAFEKEVAETYGVAHAIGVSSGTDALLMMLMAAGVGPGDEVITSSFSFFAAAEAIARLHARPVFSDIDPRTFNLDPMDAAKHISPRTKAILPVHLFGRAATTDGLEAICAAKGISILEDAAQAIGATDGRGRCVGAMGRSAALSFFPTKNLGGFGDGGMIVTEDEAFANHVRRLRIHGAEIRNRHTMVGGNFRMDELQAALLRVKLPHLSLWTSARRRIAARYRQTLATTPLGLPPDDVGSVWNQFVVRVPEEGRAALVDHLARRKIESAIYYPTPLHTQPCFAELGYSPDDFPHAKQACREVLALPIYPELTDVQICAVVDAIHDFFTGGGTSGRS